MALSVWYSVEMLDRPSGGEEMPVFYAGPMETESFELRCLTADNITAAGRAKNRRVEIVVTDNP